MTYKKAGHAMLRHSHMRVEKKRPIRAQHLVLAAMVVIAVSTALYVYEMGRNYREHGQLHAIELSTGALIPADAVQRVNEENAAFLQIQKGLNEMKKQNDKVNAVFLFTRTGDDGHIILLADSEETDSQGYHLSEEAISSIEQSFSEEKTVMTSPMPIGQDMYLRTFVPIIDYNTGTVTAVLGIDFEPAFGRQNMNMIHTVVFAVCVVLLALGVFFAILRNKSLRNMDEKLKSSEVLFRTIFKQAPIGIAIGKEDTLISDINPAYEKIVGRTKEELTAMSWTEYTHPDDLQKDLAFFKRFTEGDIPDYSMEKRYIRPDGSVVWVNMVIAPLEVADASEHSKKHLCLITDITERVRAERALKESERSKGVLLSHLPGMAYRCYYDRDWTMQFVSDGCFALTGYQSESLLYNRELSYNELIAPEHRDIIWKEWSRVIEEKRPFRYEYKIIPAGGNRKWVLEMGQAIYDDDGNVEALEGIVIDITDQKMREAQIQYMSDHDYMTGLYNRRYFEKMMAQVDAGDSLPLSIAVADINGLRLINDAFGHGEGDRVIIETAYVLRGCCRKGDVLARTGANEFSILMPNTDNKQAAEMINQLDKACDRYNKTLKNRSYDINLSIGYATKSKSVEIIEQVAKSAEDHMHNRKLLDRQGTHSTLLNSIMATMYERSQETQEHAERLSRLAKMIGNKLNLPQKSLNELELLSMLHDIGKVGIDDSILNKAGELSSEEWDVMKKHPEIGYRIAMTSPELEPIAEYILSHHERWDGTGYPRGLNGSNIPLLARILAVADAYDAMTEDRVYRKAMPVDKAVTEIRKNAGTQFDPEIARIFIECLWG